MSVATFSFVTSLHFVYEMIACRAELVCHVSTGEHLDGFD